MSAPEPEMCSGAEEPVEMDSSEDEAPYGFASVWVTTEMHDEEENSSFDTEEGLSPGKSGNRFNNTTDDGTLLACSECEFTAKYPSKLQRHIASMHQDKSQIQRPHKCDKCDYATPLKWNLAAHRRKHATEKEYKCHLCPYETAYKYNYLKHSKVHTQSDNAVYKCDKCPFRTKFHGHITRHLAKLHNEIPEKALMCPYCEFTTLIKWRLNSHTQKSRQEAPIKCRFCEFQTHYQCEHKKHRRLHNCEMVRKEKQKPKPLPPDAEKDADIDDKKLNKLQNTFQIDPEGIEWKSIDVLESDDKEKPFQCLLCDYKSRYKATVRRHYQRLHTSSDVNPFKCLNCDFSTKTRDQIALHNKRSVSAQPLRCNKCEFTTTFRCQLVVHERTHYEHKCTECGFSYKNKYELRRHYDSVHLGDGMKCSMCDFRAARKDTLAQHMTIHSGKKPFKCEHCSYTSIRKSLLITHVKRYHSDIPKDYKIISQSKIAALIVSGTDESVNASSCGEY